MTNSASMSAPYTKRSCTTLAVLPAFGNVPRPPRVGRGPYGVTGTRRVTSTADPSDVLPADLGRGTRPAIEGVPAAIVSGTAPDTLVEARLRDASARRDAALVGDAATPAGFWRLAVPTELHLTFAVTRPPALGTDLGARAAHLNAAGTKAAGCGRVAVAGEGSTGALAFELVPAPVEGRATDHANIGAGPRHTRAPIRRAALAWHAATAAYVRGGATPTVQGAAAPVVDPAAGQPQLLARSRSTAWRIAAGSVAQADVPAAHVCPPASAVLRPRARSAREHASAAIARGAAVVTEFGAGLGDALVVLHRIGARRDRARASRDHPHQQDADPEHRAH